MALCTSLWIHGTFDINSVNTLTEYKLSHGGVNAWKLEYTTNRSIMYEVTKVEKIVVLIYDNTEEIW